MNPPIVAIGYAASGNSVSLSLEFAPAAGTDLTIIENTGRNFISGQFDNLPHGKTVWLSFNHVSYKFVANYYAGSGNDLALQWADRDLVSWGWNSNGQLGNGTTATSSEPVAVGQLGILSEKIVVAISAGATHSLALCSDGSIAAWGADGQGQLGSEETFDSVMPVWVDRTGILAGKTVVAISAGAYHSLALCSDGSVATWGSNAHGQLGDGTYQIRGTPVLLNASGVLAGRAVVAVSAGQYHSIALCSDGTIAAWGGNAYGQVGDGTTNTALSPVVVLKTGALTGKSVTAVSAGANHSLVLCSDGTVVAWGDNSGGQLGNGTYQGSTVPFPVTNTGALAGKVVTRISAGSLHSLALCSNGTVASWGNNSSGELGLGTFKSSNLPVLAKSGALVGKTTKAIAAGTKSSTFLRSDSVAATSGDNFYGQLGNGTTVASTMPILVKQSGVLAGKSIIAISAGNWHSLALAARPIVPDSTLAELSASSVRLAPALHPAKLSYSASVPNSVTAIMVTSTASDPFASVKINGGDATVGGPATVTVPLAEGDNTIKVQVTTDGGTNTTTYTILVLRASSINFTYTSASQTPVTDPSFEAAGLVANFSLNFAPPTGATLGVIDNTGVGSINGRFANLAHGQTVALVYQSVTYKFVANYYGGTGNDLVLVWARQKLTAWGYNYSGQLGNRTSDTWTEPIPAGHAGILPTKTVVVVAAGGSHSLALCSDGTVASWGRNDGGQLGDGTRYDSGSTLVVSHSGVLAGKTVTAISAGASHSLALCSDGTVVSWGTNVNGQLGTGTTTDSSVPVQVLRTGALAAKTVVKISAGAQHSLALCSDGTLVGWGATQYGQLGNFALGYFSANPVVVSRARTLEGKTIVAISAGGFHNLALCSDGTIGAWGMGDYGQLGYGENNGSTFLLAVRNTGVLVGKTVIAISAGYVHSLALCSDGTAVAWGANYENQLGDGTDISANTPVLVGRSGVLEGKAVAEIVAGYYHNLAKLTDGSIVSWGLNEKDQLGDGFQGSSSLPVLVSRAGILGGKSAGLLAAGYGHSLALCSDGTLAGWGDNGDGQLGIGEIGSSRIPVPLDQNGILSGKTILAVAAGFGHSLAVCADGSVASWGYNDMGQLGDGDFYSSSVPAPVVRTGALAGKTVVAVSAGLMHSMALCSDGSVVTWGSNYSGQLGNGATGNSAVPVAVDQSGVLAGKTVVAVAAADYHSLALCDDGTIVAWGSNVFGGLGIGNVTAVYRVPVAVNQTGDLFGKSVIAIAAGGLNSLVLCSDGSMASWGVNGYSQLGAVPSLPGVSKPVTVSQTGALAGKSVKRISMGTDHSLAVCSDGSVAAWGRNQNGQLGLTTSSINSPPILVDRATILAGKSVVSISAKADHNLAICSDGTLVAWGYNKNGQLGNQTSVTSITPLTVDRSGILSGQSITAVAAGGGHSLALAASAFGHDSRLADLSIFTGASGIEFNPEISSYTLTAPIAVGSARVIATATDPYATITLNGVPTSSGAISDAIPLHPGSNIISIRVTSDDGTTTKAYTITVLKGGYPDWVAEYSGLADSSTEGDPDRDGIPNLLEYVLGTNPTSSSATALPLVFEDASTFTFKIKRRFSSTADTCQIFQYSVSMDEWVSVAIDGPETPWVRRDPVDASDYQQVTISIPKGTAKRLFGRLKVTR